ncbi:MAG: hypothetical protein K0S85_97 [Pseudomonas orientalis]|nr:hypothetical protein [Pseudomonas orientalis]
MNQKLIKRMMWGALLAMVLQCQMATAECDRVGRQHWEESRCLPT